MCCLVLACILATKRELKISDENEAYAKNISILPIIQVCIWNYVLFLTQFASVVNYSVNDFPLALPSSLIFVYVNIFQMKVLSKIWRSANHEFILSHPSPEYIRELIIGFNCKAYIVIIFGVVAVFNMLYMPLLIIIFMSILWVSQIIQNIWNMKSKAPSMLYILSVTFQQLYVPVLSYYIL